MENTSRRKVQIIGIVLVLTLICFIASGCPNTDTNSNEAVQSQLEHLRETRDAIYPAWKAIYDTIEGNLYYTDIQYLVDMFETTIREKTTAISVRMDSGGGMYQTTWIVYYRFLDTNYKLMYLTTTFSQSATCSQKKVGTYAIDKL